MILPVLDDGFRVKEDELAGDKGDAAGDSSQESAKWLEKGCFSHQNQAVLTLRAGLCLGFLSCPMPSLQLGFRALRSLGWGLAVP